MDQILKRFCRQKTKEKIRICKKCHEMAKTTNMLDRVMKLMEKGSWICPNRNPECGSTIREVVE